MTEELLIPCRACGEQRSLDEYRLFATQPATSYMDFCVHCERKEGTLSLYRRFNAYGTPEIVQAVFAAERTPEARRTEDQVRLLVQRQQQSAPETNEEVIHRELARRELARRRLVFYTVTFHPLYKPGWVHQDICRRLERFVEQVERGESPRLMIAMPPRLGKSLLASDIFPSWVLGRHPEWGIIGASYAQSLPIEFSRNIRDRVQSPEYQAMFADMRIRADAKAVETWKTTKGGGYIAAGVGVGINGKGMHIGIADDLIKDAEAGASDVIRAAAKAWFRTVFYTRLAPGGGILLIGTRWHDDDVQGAALAQEEALRRAGVPDEQLDNWEVVSYPAIAEHDEFLLSSGQIWRGALPEDEPKARLLRAQGEALHPERYPLRDLLRIKHVQTPAEWSAVYQQNPTPDSGDFFKRHDFRYRALDPDYWPTMRVFVTADYAIKKNQRNDYTVFVVCALSSDDDLYVLGIFRDRIGTYQIAQKFVDIVAKYRPEIYAGEQGQIHESVWPVMQKQLEADPRRLHVSVDESLVPIVDKESRARPLQSRVQMHKLYFACAPEDVPYEFQEAQKEMLRFPNGTHDDIVDALAWAARLALNMSLPAAPSKESKFVSWRDKFNSKKNHSHMAA